MNRRKRCALELLAASGTRGRIDSFFLARFTLELLDLVRDGLATAWPENRRAGNGRIETARFRITDAGRRALERLAESGTSERASHVQNPLG